MLRIIEGGFYSDAYEGFKKEISELVASEKKVFLIVPEQQAVIAEKEMSDILPPSASLCFEVTNFTRLANTVWRKLGGLKGDYADSGKEALIMWNTLAELAPVLHLTGGHTEINAGLVSKALRAVNEMKGLSATPEELAALSENDTVKNSRRLAEKLADISRIMSLYNTLLTKKYSSVRDESERLAQKLAEHPDFLSDAHFFLTGFTSFTEPQYKVISELIKRCELTVYLPLPEKSRRGFEYRELSETERHLTRRANLCGEKTMLIKRDGVRSDADAALESVCANLWKSRAKIDNNCLRGLEGKLRIFEACDPYEECDFIAGDIKRRVMGGALWRDFAIVARDSKKYEGILDSSLDGAGVPHFISKRKSVSSYEAIKLIFTAFAIFESGFAREDVISYAKCRLCGISGEACDEFELYTEKWQLEKDSFTNGIFWNMSPEGYSSRKSGAAEETLIRINETREKIIAPLMKFCDNLTSQKTVREYAEVLVGFLVDISLEEKLGTRAAELASLGETDAACENERLWDIICTSLDSLVEVAGDTECNPRAFIAQLKVILSEADVGKIPAFYDEVTVGSADMIRLSDKKHIYLLGINEGEFPAHVSSASYFTERDRLTLESVGFFNGSDTETLYARELFFFTRAFASAKESVTLLYSQRNTDLAPSATADVIGAIVQMTEKAVASVKISEISPLEKIYSPSMAMEVMSLPTVSLALEETGYAHEVSVAAKDIEASDATLDGETVKLMYPGDMALTQTRIDTYVSCPFSYYLRFNLGLSENVRAEFDARNIGTFIHAILENFFSEVKNSEKTISELSEEDRKKLVDRAAKRYLLEVSEDFNAPKGRTKILLDRLTRSAMPIVDGLCDELEGCAFTPRYFELRIGSEDDNLPRPATFKDKSGNNIHVYGSIDRVDTYKRGDDVFVRVIDYKTGHKPFSPGDIDEGKNLQMFLYLKAIVDSDNERFKKNLGVTGNGQILPAGVIYVKTDMSDVVIPGDDENAMKAAIKKKQERRGMLLDDSASLDAMNKAFIPVKFKKDGTPDARYEKYLYTYKGWGELDEKITGKVCEVSEKMRSGDISTTKQKNNPPCDFCKFKPICRKKI